MFTPGDKIFPRPLPVIFEVQQQQKSLVVCGAQCFQRSGSSSRLNSLKSKPYQREVEYKVKLTDVIYLTGARYLSAFWPSLPYVAKCLHDSVQEGRFKTGEYIHTSWTWYFHDLYFSWEGNYRGGFLSCV